MAGAWSSNPSKTSVSGCAITGMFPRAGGVLAVTKPDDQSLVQREGGGGQGGCLCSPVLPTWPFPTGSRTKG